jgi:hypothetical protein
MVIITFKDGYSLGFEMATSAKEKALVSRFNSGSLKPSTVLDLKSKGSYKIEEIQAMEYCPVKVVKKEAPQEDEDLKKFKEAVNGSKKQDHSEKLREFEKVFGDALKKKD